MPEPENLNSATPTDQELWALLDEALGPESIPGGPPAGLCERILAATADDLKANRPAVLARISGSPLWRAAAAVALAALVGLGVFLNLDEPQQPTLAALEADLAQLNEFRFRTAPIDQEIALLAMQVELAAADPEPTDPSLESLLGSTFEDWDTSGSNVDLF